MTVQTDQSPFHRRPPQWTAVPVYLVASAVMLVALLLRAPRQFWIDDAVTQYGPASWWLGRQQLDGQPPLMDPALGSASNFVVDMQYGVLDPFHWLLQRLAAQTDDIVLVSQVFGCLCIGLIGAAALALLLAGRVHPVVAAAGAVGVSGSGFLLWQAASWWPLLWGTVWLLWLWVGLVGRSRAAPLLVGVAGAALLASGYPYVIVLGALLVAASTIEQVVRDGPRSLLGRAALTRFVALLGALVWSAPTLLSMVQAAPYTSRPFADPLLGNSGFGVPNLLDVVAGTATLLPDFGIVAISLLPLAACCALGLPLLALVDWRRAVRSPGVLTAVLLTVVALAATQLPAVTGPFRHPFLFSVGYQVALPVLALTAVTAAGRTDRPRLLLAGGLLLACSALAVSRSPALVRWHVLALLVGATAVAAAVLLVRGGSPRLRSRLAAPGLLVAVVAGPLLSAGVATTVVDRILAQSGSQPTAATGFSVSSGAAVQGRTAEDYAAQSVAPGEQVTVYPFFGPDIGAAWATGAFAGHGNLLAGSSFGYGYDLAVVQTQRARHDCRSSGSVCDVDALLETASTADDLLWVDVLSSNAVLVPDTAPAPLLEHLRATWDEVEAPPGWARFDRRTPLPGSISVARGVDVDTTAWRAGPGRRGQEMERYSVSTGASEGTLVFSTTWWPGITAQLDGVEVPVGSLDGAVVQIEVPAGVAAAELTLAYEPIGARVLVPSLWTGVALVLAATSVSVVRPTRRVASPST